MKRYSYEGWPDSHWVPEERSGRPSDWEHLHAIPDELMEPYTKAREAVEKADDDIQNYIVGKGEAP